MKKLYIYILTFIISTAGFSNNNSNKEFFTILDVSGVPTILCANESFTLAYSFGGTAFLNSGNEFRAQISDAAGVFNGDPAIDIIGSIISLSFEETIYVTIPETTVFGAGYRIRVIATNTTEGVAFGNPNISGVININCITRDYYWIGGAGNWSDLSHWEYTTDDFNYFAATEIPQPRDNVIFDETTFPSGGQLTLDVVASCNDFYWDPLSGANNPVIWGNSFRLNVYGDFEIAPGVYRDVRYIYFDPGADPGKSNVYLNFGDNLIQYDPNTTWWEGGNIYFQGDGSYDQDSDLIAEYLQIGGGATLYSNDYQYNIAQEFYNGNGSFFAGGSTIYARGFSMYDTYDAGFSNVILNADENGNVPYLYGSQIHNNVTIESGICNISSDNTFEDLSIITGGGMSLGGGTTQTINNTFIAQGTRDKMVEIKSANPGSVTNIFMIGAAPATGDFVSITDVSIDNGAANTYNVTNAIDNGGNSGWIFSLLTPLDYYWIGGTGNFSDLNHWATSDGGSTLRTALPGNLDNLKFTSNSFPASGTITLDQQVTVNDVTWLTGSGATSPEIYANWGDRLTIKGNLIMDDGVQRRINEITFDSQNGTNQIDLADNTGAQGNIEFVGGGNWDLLSDLSSGGNDIYFHDGTLNTNNHSLSFNGIYIYNDLTILNLGSSDLYAGYGIVNNATSPTIIPGTSTIYIDSYWSGLIKGPLTFNNVIIDNEIEIRGDNTFNTLTANPGSNLKLFATSTQTIAGNLNLTGSRSTLVNVESFDWGTPGIGTFNTTGATVNADFVSIKDNAISPARSATNAVNNGGNTGWSFSAIVPLDFRWIGGSGNWDDAAHWESSPVDANTYTTAAFSPGPVDNVFFTSNSFPSGGTLTLASEAQCNNMTWEAGSGSSFPTIHSDWNIDLVIHGSLQMDNGVTRDVYRINFDTNVMGNTIDMADNLFLWGDVDFNGTGGWTLLDSLTTVYLNIRGGILDTDGHPINIIEQMYMGTGTGTVNLGSSHIYLKELWSDAQNMTFNAQTSTFFFNGEENDAFIRGNYPIDLYNVDIEGSTKISSSYTMDDLYLNQGAELTLSAGTIQTVISSFSAYGTRSQMINIHSDSNGAQATLNLGSSTINADFVILQDNIVNASTTPVSATNSVDNGNNVNWSIDPITPLSYYWIGGTGNWSDLTHWATTDGGTTLQPELPGVVDNVFFTSNAFPNSGILTLDQPAACHDMTWNDGSFNPTITGDNNAPLTIHGDLTIADGVNRNVQYITFDSQETNQISLGDNRFESSYITFKGGGIWNLIDSLASSSMEMRAGTFNTNNRPITLQDDFSLNGNEPITMNFGSSEIRLRWIYNYANNVSVDEGTANITVANGGGFQGSQVGFYDLTLEGEASMYVDVNITNNLTVIPGAKLMISPSSIITVGQLIANGTRPLPTTIKSTQEGQQGTISQATGSVNATHIILKDNNATGGATFIAQDAYDKGNNTGWSVIDEIVGQSYYWSVASGNWSDKNSWTLDDNTVIPATAPGPADNILITTNSAIASGGTMNLDIPAECNNMTWSDGLSGASFSGDYESPLTIHGSITLATGVSANVEHLIFDTDDTGQTINMAGNTGNQYINYEFLGTGDWTLLDSLNAWDLRLQGGTLFTDGFPLNTEYFSLSSNSTTPGTLNLGASNMYFNRIDGTWSGTFVAGTSTLFPTDNAIIYSSWAFNNMEVDGKLEIYAANSFNKLTILPGSEVQFYRDETQTISQLNAVGLRSRPITIKSTEDGTQATILQASGVVAAEYLILQDNNALGGATFSAQNSIDNGNVNGWNITAITPRNYFWVGGSGSWSEFGTHWANADNGTSFYNSSPGPLDNVNFTVNAFPSGGSLTLDFPTYVDNMDWTGNTSAITITHGSNDWNNDLTVGGSLTLANGVTRDININFDSDDTGNTIFMADNLHTVARTYFYGNGEWSLTGPYEAARTYFYGGTFNTDNYNVLSPVISLRNDNISYWGTSVVTTREFYSNYLNNGTSFNSESSTFNFSNPSSNFISGDSRFYLAIFDGNTYIEGNNIFFNASATSGILDLRDNQAFNSLIMAAGTSISIQPGTTQTFSAALDLNGTLEAPVVINSYTEGEQGIFSMPAAGTVTATYVHLKDNAATGGASFDTSNSSDFGNVTGWIGLLTGQTIDFGPLTDQALSVGSFDVSATSSSSLNVTFEISQGGGTISGTTITPASTGLIGVRALQVGDATYGSALPSTRWIHIDATTEPNEIGNMKEAKLVLGQLDKTSSDAVYSDITVPEPWGVAVSNTGKMAVAHGSRVLIWNTIPADASIPADVVVGQVDFNTDISNTATQSNFYEEVYSVAFAGDKLIVADRARLLIWNTIPVASGTPADVVVGQSDFFSIKEGTADNSYEGSLHAVTTYIDPQTSLTILIVSDFSNNRVLIYNNIPTMDGASADVVVGQQDFTSNIAGTNANELFRPIGVSVSPDGKLLVADYGNSRVLVFNSIPEINGASADVVLGQADFGLNESGTGPTTFTSSTGVSVSRSGKLAIADFGNNRVLIYNVIPTASTVEPDYILGQPDNTQNSSNYNSISGRSLSLPIAVNWDISNNLFVSDNRNNRILLYGAADLEGPAISSQNLVTTYTAGAGSQPSSVTVTDRSGIASIKAFWEEVTSFDPANPVYEESILADIGNDTYEFDLSVVESKSSTPTGIEYYIEITDNLGNVTSNSGNKEVLPISYPNGIPVSIDGVGNTTEAYRLLALRLDLDNPTVNDVFASIYGGSYDNSIMRIFSYAGGTATTYNEATGSTSLKVGKGYFVLAAAAPSGAIAPAGTTSFISTDNGSGANIHEHSINLVNGWNLIGNPFMHDVLWSDIEALSGITSGEVDQLQTYNGSWNTSINSIRSGEGVFVHNNTGSSFTLRLPAKQNTGGRIASTDTPNRNSLIEPSWEVEFKTIGNNGSNYIIGGIGMEEEANYSKDQFDLLNPPTFGNTKIMDFNHPEFITTSFKKDIRETSNEEKWSFEYKVEETSGGKHSINWDNSYFGKNTPDLYLVDKTHFTTINMKEVNTYSFSHGGITKFEVYFGDNVLEQITPEQLITQSPFPNPFNNEITFNIGLPQDDHYSIDIRIFDSVGKMIRSISESEISSGYNSILWNGLSNDGRSIPSGMYTYSIHIKGSNLDIIEPGKLIKR